MTKTLCQRAFLIALEEVGVAEIPGEKNNPRILRYHESTTLKAEDETVPWCSAFVNYCIQEAGGRGTRLASARSWLSWGHEILDPEAGDIVVFSADERGPAAGHVGFYVGEKDADILCFGGNQFNRVCVHSYPKSRVLGYRRSNDVQTEGPK